MWGEKSHIPRIVLMKRWIDCVKEDMHVKRVTAEMTCDRSGKGEHIVTTSPSGTRKRK